MGECGICGHELNKDVLVLENIPEKTFCFSDKTVTLNIAKCGHCGVVQLFDVPLNDDFRDVHRSIESMPGHRMKKKKDLDDFIEEFGLWSKRFFEMGCGNGQYLDILREIGVECDGYEANEDNIDECIDKEYCVSDGVAFKEEIFNKYDVIFSFYFLEHMPDPVDVLTNVYDKLNPGGMIYIEVPNYKYIEKDGLWLEFTRDHRFYYDLSSMRFLLSKTGFKLLKITPGDLTLKVIAKKPDDFENVRESMEKDIVDFDILTNKIGNYVIVGAGHYTQTLLNKTANKPVQIYDSVPDKIGKILCGVKILPQGEIRDCEFNNIIISCGAYNQEAEKNIERLTEGKNIIIWG
ncbi:MAG: class I SAM-dependent methyltransferase [PVC group bacterium]|nr:class I SAM-dependent methyltransferase [PVC group bacterium]